MPAAWPCAQLPVPPLPGLLGGKQLRCPWSAKNASDTFHPDAAERNTLRSTFFGSAALRALSRGRIAPKSWRT